VTGVQTCALPICIAACEAEEKETTAVLADPALYDDFAKAKPFIERQAAARSELARLYEEWEAAQRRLEELQREAL
jgi:ATP-binding cassette subfamily F protein 3